MKLIGTILKVLGTISMLVASILFLLPLIQKLSDKLYKAHEQKEEIDFDDLGPEVVKKSDLKEE